MSWLFLRKHKWGDWCQKQASQARIRNCILQYSVRRNYLSVPEIHTSSVQIHKYVFCILYHKWNVADFLDYPSIKNARTSTTHMVISWLLMAWRRQEPGHQQPWYSHGVSGMILTPGLKMLTVYPLKTKECQYDNFVVTVGAVMITYGVIREKLSNWRSFKCMYFSKRFI